MLPTTHPDFKYWAFISYSHRDEEFCSWLHNELETYKTPSALVGQTAKDGCYTIPEKLYPIFRDREELAAGANLSDAITAALNTSRYLVVICSEASAQSKWVNTEIEYFESLGREKYILPIILNGEPNSKNGKDPECFPPALRDPKEPLAADAREGKDGKEAALMKLRAGLLGVGLEDLVQRELQRKKNELEEETRRRQEFECYYGLALAEKANRAFTENRVNDGMIYSSHALVYINEQWDKEFEISRFLTLRNRLEKNIVFCIYATNEFLSIHFSPDGKTLASGSRDKTVRLWDVASGKSIATLSGHSDYVRSVHFSPDGKMLASGNSDNTVRLWDVASGQSIATLSGHTNWVWSVHFSPDGKTLASGSGDNTVRLWDVASGQSIATLSGHTESVYSVHFSPDGKTLASGSDDKTVRLWDVASGKSIATLSGHTEPVISVHFSPDGKTLASGSWDKTVRLWDVASRKSIATLSGHTESVLSVHFSPDGKTLASGSGDNTVRLWPLNDIFIRDWKAQAAKDEKRYGLKLEGLRLVPLDSGAVKP